MSNRISLSGLPEEIILEIFKHLPRRSQPLLMCTSKVFGRIGHEALYRGLTSQQRRGVVIWAGDRGREQPMLSVLRHILLAMDSNDAIGPEALISAARGGCNRVLQRLLSAGVNPNTISGGSFPLLEACRSNNPGCFVSVRMLLANGASRDVVDNSRGRNALHWAALTGNTNIMMLLIKAGVNVNSVTGINNVTPLLLATSKSHFRAAELLVNHGADVNIADTLGRSPLINAAELGTLSIVDLLVRRGADINHTNSAGRSALTFGVEKGAANVVQRLVDAGCDVNLVDHIEKTALYYAPGNWAPWNRIDEIIQGAPGYKPRKR